jgi:hypothetical protein
MKTVAFMSMEVIFKIKLILYCSLLGKSLAVLLFFLPKSDKFSDR